jgi:stage III sporulation protein AB
MDYKWIGAILIIAGSGGFGFSLAAAHHREESALEQLICAADYMACELRFKMTPLPDLFLHAGLERKGVIGQFFRKLGNMLSANKFSVPEDCIVALLQETPELPGQAREQLRLMGESLGKFDLEGQLAGIDEVRSRARSALENLRKDKDLRLRSYQTLSLCAGAALAVLLI